MKFAIISNLLIEDKGGHRMEKLLKVGKYFVVLTITLRLGLILLVGILTFVTSLFG